MTSFSRACVAVAALVVVAASVASAQWEAPSSGGGGSEVTPAEIVAAVQDAGILPSANRDMYANSFVATNRAPDGGPGTYSFIGNGGTLKLGTGSQNEIIPIGNRLDFNNSETRFSTLYVTQPACTPNTDCFWFADATKWFGTFPSSSTPACASNKEGGLKGNNTDHELYYCDGTTNQQVAFTRTWSGTLDFAAFVNDNCQSLTFTATGALLNEPVLCGGYGAIQNADPDLSGTCAVTANDTVNVRVCCNDSLGCADPSSILFTAAVLR